jgi:succinoglycan biosynthesis protein ExoU
MNRVAVIVAAHNSARTIARAVRSALAEPEVAEVIVVDDASTDRTVEAARAADDSTGRLFILAQSTNRGPAAARNVAIASANSPIVAILDADDYFLPGRLTELLKLNGWDLIGDNIAFVSDAEGAGAGLQLTRTRESPEQVSLSKFIIGNLARFGKSRRELGFIKPLIRRDWFTECGLRYDEQLRLGEDYALYAEMLASGARFLLTRSCGYVAVIRQDSLAANHRISDLENLLSFDRRLQRSVSLSRDEQIALRAHERQLEIKIHVRRLGEQRRKSIWAAVAAAFRRLELIPDLCLMLLSQRFNRLRKLKASQVRYLLD